MFSHITIKNYACVMQKTKDLKTKPDPLTKKICLLIIKKYN